jgi:hypothetical protein
MTPEAWLAVLDFQARIARYKLVSRRAIHDELILDPVVAAAQDADVLALPRPERLPHVQRLAD